MNRGPVRENSCEYSRSSGSTEVNEPVSMAVVLCFIRTGLFESLTTELRPRSALHLSWNVSQRESGRWSLPLYVHWIP